jgi:CubicO group peptidase (beta-lactamase class C family)
VVAKTGGEVSNVDLFGDIDLVYDWASVTKLLAAMSVLVAVEEGTLSLEEPAGPPSSTVAHLLSHSSGLAPDDGTVLAAPGRRRIYSNFGFETLARCLAGAADMTFGDYLYQAVTGPLHMDRTRIAEGASPAWGAAGTLADLLLLARELLEPTLISRSTLDLAVSPAFGGIPGVLPGFGRYDDCSWGLGFEIKAAKSPHWTGYDNSPGTFGHFGRAGGFLWVDPAASVSCAVLTDQPFGPWAAESWPVLSDDVLGDLGDI